MKVDYQTLFLTIADEVDLDPFSTQYCLRRIKSEGLVFLTKVLPKLSSTVIKSLEKGYFDRSELTHFAWKGGALLHFRVILKGIFDLKTGLVLQNVDALSIYRLRQLCEYFYKLQIDYTDEELSLATDRFIATEQELSSPFDKSIAEQARKDFETYFPQISSADITDVLQHSSPRAGSGTFSGKSDYCSKWYTRKYHDDSYPHAFRAYHGHFRYLASAPSPVENVIDPRYSEVLFVPKDSRGPRVIIREPFSSLKAQMAMFDWLSEKLEAVSNIRFSDQLVNRSLAESSSVTKLNATVDLKEASDRVRLDVALHVFRYSPAIRYFLLNSRTAHAKLPNGEILNLRKVAGMGSGLTFCLMSLLIYLVSVRCVANSKRITFRQASKLVHTYGDDLIVPVSCLESVCTNLTKIGLLINSEKSFSVSHFRESCGGDYFNGQDVTPVRLKLSSTLNRNQYTHLSVEGDFTILQVERHCRELVKAGFLTTARFWYRNIISHMRKRELLRPLQRVDLLRFLPLVSGESPYIGVYTLQTEEVYNSLTVDGVGMVKGAKALLPVPYRDLEENLTSLHSLGNYLRGTYKRKSSWSDLFSVSGSSATEVSVPRKLSYKWVRNPSYGLIV